MASTPKLQQASKGRTNGRFQGMVERFGRASEWSYFRHSARFITASITLLVVTILGCIVIVDLSIKPHFSGNVWLAVVWIFLFGAIFGFALNAIVRQGWREFLDPFARVQRGRSFYISLLMTLIVITAAGAWSNYFGKTVEGADVGEFLNLVNNSSGGLFAMITGGATIFALALTVRGLWEIKRTIISFSDLIDRLCLMLNKASFIDPVHMVCYTPALGCLALPKRDFERFYQSLVTPDGEEPHARIICLGAKELNEWHRLFIGRRTVRGKVDLRMVEEADERAKRMINYLSKGEDPVVSHRQDIGVKYLPFQFMPGFYFFFTSTRAIIVAPFFLQYPEGAPKPINEDVSQVEMIGFETSNRGIIDTLRTMYERYRTLPSTLIGNTSMDLEIQKSENLQNVNLPLADKQIQDQLVELRKQFGYSIQGEYQELLSKQNSKIVLSLRLLYKEASHQERD